MLATEAVVVSPEIEWVRSVFRRVALVHAPSAAKVAEHLAEKLVLSPSFETVPSKDKILTEMQSLALECMGTLIKSGAYDQALEIIERTGSEEIFDIPLHSVRLLREPKHREKIAQERLALVDTFIERYASSDPTT
jgi:hypothetical protein